MLSRTLLLDKEQETDRLKKKIYSWHSWGLHSEKKTGKIKEALQYCRWMGAEENGEVVERPF